MFWLAIAVIGFFVVSLLLWGVLNAIAHPRQNFGMLVFLVGATLIGIWVYFSTS